MSEEQKADVVKSKLEAAVEAARKAEEARDIFLANMSHELRTPINTMLGLNELIIRESQDETIKGYAMDIKQASRVLRCDGVLASFSLLLFVVFTIAALLLTMLSNEKQQLQTVLTAKNNMEKC